MTSASQPIFLNSRRTVFISATAAAFVLSFSPSYRAEQVAPNTASTCTLEPGPVRTVTRIVDGETVALDDGSEVRLIGALAPRAFDAGAAHGAWPAEAAAIGTLTDLVLGRAVKLAYGGRRTDRYGRQLAHLFLNSGSRASEAETWVQGAMLSAGASRAYGLAGNFACASELLANESVAKGARLGVWATAIYRPKSSRFTGLLLSRRSHFEVVEGTVSTVSRTKSAVYLNFGSDWKSDFTARIGKDVLDANSTWNQTLARLEGQTISVRGWIERRNGPMIDIRDPSQIESHIESLEPPSAPRPAEGVSAPDESGQPSAPNNGAKNKRPAFELPKPPGAVDL